MKERGENILFDVQDVSIGYAQRRVMNRLNFQIEKGELVAIIGVNGSGKSTLLKTLTLDLPTLEGEVFFKGRLLSHFSRKELAEHISVVLPKPNFSRNLTVYEIVALARHPYTNWLGVNTAKDKKAVVQALKAIGILPLMRRKAGELSDGQLQKVFIARAFAQDTELIILDEPTNHLDLYFKAFVFKLLKSLSTALGKTIIFATHELNLAMQMCDKIILLNEHDTLVGTPRELAVNPIIQKIFPADLIDFDPASRTFKLKTD